MQHEQRKQLQCENVATRTQNLHSHFAGNIFFNWTLETASGNDMHNIKCSTAIAENTTTQQGSAAQSCSGQLAVGNSVFGVRPFSRLQRVQCKYKSTKCSTNTSRMACQTRQSSHRCINCLIVCRDRDVIMSIKLLPKLWPDRQLDNGPGLDLCLLSALGSDWCRLCWLGTRGIGKFDLWLIMRLMSFHNLIIPGHGRDSVHRRLRMWPERERERHLWRVSSLWLQFFDLAQKHNKP